jgi:sulfite exporter TauE/SafE
MSAIAAGLAMGFLGSAHCAAMCGGIAAALSGPVAGPASPLSRVLVQNAARVAAYATAGAVAGGFGATLAGAAGAEGAFVLRALAALVTIAAGLQIGGWAALLLRFEAAGAVLWKHLAPLAARARASRSFAGAAVFGALWGFLPCGLVYSALVLASTSGSALDGAAAMAAFGLGTTPATLALGIVAGRGLASLRGLAARQLAGALVVCFGVWTFAGAAVSYREAAAAGAPACHAEPAR